MIESGHRVNHIRELVHTEVASTKKGCRESERNQSRTSKIDDAIRRGEAAIREARRAERENTVMIKPQPRGVCIDGWDI